MTKDQQPEFETLRLCTTCVYMLVSTSKYPCNGCSTDVDRPRWKPRVKGSIAKALADADAIEPEEEDDEEEE